MSQIVQYSTEWWLLYVALPFFASFGITTVMLMFRR